MTIVRRIALALSVLAAVSSVSAQQLVKGEKYFLRVPLQAFTPDGVTWRGQVMMSASVEPDATGVKVNGRSDWLALGFPMDKVFNLNNAGINRKTAQYELELGDISGSLLMKLRFPSESVAAAVEQQLVVPAKNENDVKAAKDAAFDALARKTFTGTASQMSPEQQRAVLVAAQAAGSASVATETYKDKSYLVLNLGSGEYIYNTLQMNRTKRVARRTADVLGTVKNLYKSIGSCPNGIQGIEVTYQARYKDFLDKFGTEDRDSIVAYFPCDLIAKFASADVTSQALVNGSVILVGGDRVDVSLTE